MLRSCALMVRACLRALMVRACLRAHSVHDTATLCRLAGGHVMEKLGSKWLESGQSGCVGIPHVTIRSSWPRSDSGQSCNVVVYLHRYVHHLHSLMRADAGA